MNCCTQHPSSPASLTIAVSTKFDIEFDYGVNDDSDDENTENDKSTKASSKSKTGFAVVSSEDERQEARIMDALSIVLSNQNMREARLMKMNSGQGSNSGNSSHKQEPSLSSNKEIGKISDITEAEEQQEQPQSQSPLSTYSTTKSKADDESTPTPIMKNGKARTRDSSSKKEIFKLLQEEEAPKENKTSHLPSVSSASATETSTGYLPSETEESETEESRTEQSETEESQSQSQEPTDESTDFAFSIKTTNSGGSRSSKSSTRKNKLEQRVPTPRPLQHRTNSAKISMLQSPSHREEFELELPSNDSKASIHTTSTCSEALSSSASSSSYKDSKTSLSATTTSESQSSFALLMEELEQHIKNNPIILDEDVDGDAASPKNCKSLNSVSTFTERKLKRTQQQLEKTKKELKKSQQELADIRQQSVTAQQEIHNVHQDWESQQTLMRNKDKELERLRLIIADRTVQMTEKTGQLSVTKVALVASENGLAAVKTQLQRRTEELEITQRELVEIKRVLSATRAELSRCKLQLDASAQRRKQFSNRALQILKDGAAGKKKDEPCDSGSNATENGCDEDGLPTGWISEVESDPSTARHRSKSWCFDSDSGSSDSGEAMKMNLRNYQQSIDNGTKRETGVQTDPPLRKRDALIPRPNRCRSKSRDGHQPGKGIARSKSSSHHPVTANAETPTVSNSKRLAQIDSHQQHHDKDGFYFDSATSSCSLALTAMENTLSMAMMTADENESRPDHVHHPGIESTNSNVSHLTGAFSEAETVTETESISSDVSAEDEATHDRPNDKEKQQQWRENKQKLMKKQQIGEEKSFVTVEQSIPIKIAFNRRSESRAKTIGRVFLTTAIGCVLSVLFAHFIHRNSEKFGISFVGGDLLISDSRTIVAGLGLVVMLWFSNLWMVVGSILIV